MRELAQPDEIDQQGFRPLFLGRLERIGPAAASGVYEYIDAPQGFLRRLRQPLGSTFLIQVGFHDQWLGGAGGDDVTSKLLEQVDPPGCDDEPDAFPRKSQGDRASDTARSAGNERGLAFELQVHMMSVAVFALHTYPDRKEGMIQPVGTAATTSDHRLRHAYPP